MGDIRLKKKDNCTGNCKTSSGYTKIFLPLNPRRKKFCPWFEATCHRLPWELRHVVGSSSVRSQRLSRCCRYITWHQNGWKPLLITIVTTIVVIIRLMIWLIVITSMVNDTTTGNGLMIVNNLRSSKQGHPGGSKEVSFCSGGAQRDCCTVQV